MRFAQLHQATKCSKNLEKRSYFPNFPFLKPRITEHDKSGGLITWRFPASITFYAGFGPVFLSKKWKWQWKVHFMMAWQQYMPWWWGHNGHYGTKSLHTSTYESVRVARRPISGIPWIFETRNKWGWNSKLISWHCNPQKKNRNNYQKRLFIRICFHRTWIWTLRDQASSVNFSSYVAPMNVE